MKSEGSVKGIVFNGVFPRDITVSRFRATVSPRGDPSREESVPVHDEM